ncbi:ribosomal protein S18 acetylase RimI-like enzyme [Kribbella aluminosa]|uniref:Ribosomal protein S18 acetylase RimI-like enzyme n=1 Tax=Kribbella aluminosa TaxID=416017 RepID=A0ABS4UHU6_9ACTN|nr:GNAT family N-acetyltransferase [Kribbella aluminosa]MBP2351216.1 ribosomal protein S18 acetylase RimI-like enzyme [Kribbella aluminosa]
MNIRTYADADLQPLIDLTIDTFGPFFEDSFRPLVGDLIYTRQHGDWQDAYRKQLPGLHDPAEHKHVAVAEQDGEIIGYVAWHVEPSRSKGTVVLLGVAEEHRRSTSATALCEHAFTAMRAAGAQYVEIGTGGDPFHAPARAFYESLGCVKLPVAVYFREL